MKAAEIKYLIERNKLTVLVNPIKGLHQAA